MSTSIQTGAVVQPVDSIQIDTTFVTHPVVVFLGPASSGKTITLLSLARFIGPDLEIVKDKFRQDPGYADSIRAFETARSSTSIAPGSTGQVDFLLLRWSKNSEPFCYFLEAPGEHYFSASRPNYTPMYLKKVLSAAYRKVFVVFFEDAIIANESYLEAYCARIRSMLDAVEAKNSTVIILFNKCDADKSVWRNGKPLQSQFERKLFGIKSPGVTELQHYLKTRYKSFEFIPYQSGDFTQVAGVARMQFLEHSAFVDSLTSAIISGIRGRSMWDLFRR